MRNKQAEDQSAASRPLGPVRQARVHKIRLRLIASVIILALWLLGGREASAQSCVVSGPRYMLIAETVRWSIEIKSGHRCLRGVRFRDVEFERLTLVSPPQSGQVALQGPGFTYVAKADFDGQDSFTLAVFGAVSKKRGSSTILVTVSVIGPHRDLAAPGYVGQPAAPTAIPQSPAPPVIDEGASFPAGAPLPPCPTWDWSKGAPPPMTPPFDPSKLYCPPPPFKPPGPPVGCICPQ